MAEQPETWPFRPLALLGLKRYFGLDGFRPGQEAALAAVTSGRDLLAVMPTGSGKSLCYQLPACLRPGVVLVISPLIALMKDQVDRLRARGLAAVHLSSGLSSAELRRNEAKLARKEVALLYVSPERLRARRVRELLARASVWLLAVDEAHCISTWGHDFRPDYRLIGRVFEELGRPTVAAFTATATERTRRDIIDQLHMQDPAQVTLDFDRPELFLEVRHAQEDAEKLDLLAETMASISGAVVVYCGTRRLAELVADFARQALSLPAAAYHAGMESEARTRVQEAFLAGTTRLIAATTAFGLGIDKPDIRAVVHYCYPGSLEEYYQEIGRAGRDGRPARCLLLYSEGDTAIHEHLMNRDMPLADTLRDVFEALPEEEWLDYAGLARRVNRSDREVEDAVQQLALLGCLALEDAVGKRAWARRICPPLDSVLARYLAHLEELRQTRRAKMAAVRAYAHAEECRRRQLLAYLGEAPGSRERCCDVCADQGRPEAPAPGLGRAYLERAEARQLHLGRFSGWALTSYFAGSGSLKKTEIGDHLQAFKYGQHRGRGAPIAEGLVELVRTTAEFADVDAVIPVPHSLSGRSFEPATELARDVEAQGGPPAWLDLLVKARETGSQKEQHSLEGRRANVADAFGVTDPDRLAGRKLILLDDFVDSGATMEAAAEALLAAGAASVVLLAVAITNRGWK